MDAATITLLLTSLVKCGAVVGVVLTLVAYTVMAERRVSAMIQDRIGPNRTGIPFTKISLWGLLQPMADGIKFLLKEEYTPDHVKKFYFYLAPVITMVPALITISVIPFGNEIDLAPIALWGADFLWGGTISNPDILSGLKIKAVLADLNVGILFVFAIVSISVYGIVLAGWASQSKYPFLGGIRATAQMISYELTMGLAVVPLFLLASKLNLSELIVYQGDYGWFAFPFTAVLSGNVLWNDPRLLLWVPMGLSFVLFLIAAFAETNRLPFDLAECETELVGGYHTEYSAMKFALFFLGEYAAMIAVSAAMVVLFFGGWHLPIPGFDGSGMAFLPTGFEWLEGFILVGVFLAKMAFFLFVFIWVRWTLPRFRYDQLMHLGWKVFLPIAFANVFLAAILIAVLKV